MDSPVSKSSDKHANRPWLSIKKVPEKIYSRFSPGYGLKVCVKDMDYISMKWSLPLQFGDENYAYTLVDIDDPRYAEECADMTQKLIHFASDRQIVALEWRKNFCLLQEAERRRASLPDSAPAKTREMMDDAISGYKARLLEVQDQKDGYEKAVEKVVARCLQIKASIKKENDLEALRLELTERVKNKFAKDDPFWTTAFDPRSSSVPQIVVVGKTHSS